MGKALDDVDADSAPQESATKAQQSGSRSPLVVLLPGLDGTAILFEPLLQQLRLDSVTVEYEQTLPSDYQALLPQVLAALPTDRDFILLGWSFSGPLALMAAATKPRGLLGVILVATFVTKPTWYLPSAIRHLARPFVFKCMFAVAPKRILLGKEANAEHRARVDRVHAQVPPEIIAARARATLTVNVEEELRACPVPILYLASSRDIVVPRTNLRRIQKTRPDLQAKALQGSHVALCTNPEAASDAIENFARTVSPPGDSHAR